MYCLYGTPLQSHFTCFVCFMCNHYTIMRIHYEIYRLGVLPFSLFAYHKVMQTYRNFLSILYSIMRTRHFSMWTDQYGICILHFVMFTQHIVMCTDRNVACVFHCVMYIHHYVMRNDHSPVRYVHNTHLSD